MGTTNPIDFALRTCESMAFAIHSVLGITEPCTGCLREAFQDRGAMPLWFWPAAGLMLAVVACANFSGNDAIVLAAQAYIAAFHFGGAFYHLKLQHHPAAACAPAVFVLFAFGVAAIRTTVLVAVLGTCACASVAAFLTWVLVRPPRNGHGDSVSLLSSNNSSSARRS